MCSVTPIPAYRYLDNGYTLEISAVAEAYPPAPQDPRNYQLGISDLSFAIDTHEQPQVNSDGAYTRLVTVTYESEVEGWVFGFNGQNWVQGVIPCCSLNPTIRIGAWAGGNMGNYPRSSFTMRVNAIMWVPGDDGTFDSGNIIPIRPFLVGSERPEFVDTPEPATLLPAALACGLFVIRRRWRAAGSGPLPLLRLPSGRRA
jgi:hypothetical protein